MKQLEKENLFLNTSLRRTLSRMRTSWYLLETDVRLAVKRRFNSFPMERCRQTIPSMWKAIYSSHIRGEVPPHITPEYDFSRLSPWGLCLLGDLHFNHRYGDTNCYYPGSPVNTTFDRDETRKYGVDIYERSRLSNYTREFYDLDLPNC